MRQTPDQAWKMIVGVSMLLLAALLGGCQASSSSDMIVAEAAFGAGDYARAYRSGARVVQTSGAKPNYRAAYMAGISAYRLGDLAGAERFLKIAADSKDRQVVGNSLAMLGLAYADRGEHNLASKTLVRATEHLDGQDRANAYFHAARAEHKLGRWAEARAYLALARSCSTDPVFRLRIAAQLGSTGYTIQLGMYADRAEARAVAQRLAYRARPLAIGLPKLVPVVSADGSQAYLVQIGQFSYYRTAADKRRQLQINDAVVVLLDQSRKP